MALQNASGMYNGSAPLNPLPYVNIAIQARNRKAAREEALNQYYNKLPDTVNDKNIRDIEIPIINEGKNKIFEFGVKNREALKNPKIDNGAAQLALDKMMRDLSGVARLSQNAAKMDLEAGKFFLNKDNQFALNNDDYLADHELHNLPVTDPRHKTIDLNKFASNRPFDSNALIKRNADIKYSDSQPEITDHPTDKLSQIVTIRPVLDEKNKQVLYDRAANDLHSNPMFASHIKNKLDKNQLDGILKIAQEQFGVTDPTKISDEDIAAAYEYSLLPVKQTVQKRIANADAVMNKRFAQQKLMEGIRQGNREKLLGMRQAAQEAGEVANDLWVESYIDKLGTDAANSTSKQYTKIKGVGTTENSIPVDAVIAKVFTRDGLSPDRLTVTSDGKYRPIFYKRDKDGMALKSKDDKYVVDEVSSVPISKDQFKLLLGGKAGTKQLNKEMVAPTKGKTSAPQQKPKADPLGLGL